MVCKENPGIKLEQGQILYGPSHFSKVLFLLLEGSIRIYKTVGAQELTLEMIKAGTMFGQATLAARPQGAYAEAMEPSRVALLGLDVLKRLVHDKPEVALKIMELLSERLHLYESQMADIGLKEVPARLAGLILRLCESEGVVSRGAIGYPLAIPRSSWAR
jgi:CRP-like cAMP-binding protein